MHGYTLLSFMISLALSALLGALMLKDAHSFLSSQIEVSQRSREILQKVRLREIMDNMLQDSDSHRLDILPRVHARSMVSYADGEINLLCSDNSVNAPNPFSDAISAISLLSAQTLRVLEAKRAGLHFEYTACTTFLRFLPDTNPQSFIGIGADSLLYLQGKSRRVRSGSKCFTLELSQKTNMFIKKQDLASPQGVRLLIPVEREYTIYLSRKGELRYVGHRAYENIENQPLFGPLAQMNLTVEKQFTPGIVLIKGHFLFPQKHEFSYASLSHLSRMDYVNLLLN